MKQGTAQSSRMGATKQEPITKIASPACVGNIGLAQGRAYPGPMYEGRGLQAPMKSTTVHARGSQGKHK